MDLPVPARYLPIIDFYLDFLKKVVVNEGKVVSYTSQPSHIKHMEDLLLGFEVEAFFADNIFFVYLMKQAYKMWQLFLPTILSLPDERAVYLYTPYEFVPANYMGKDSFFNEWLSINADRSVLLNDDNYYYTDVDNYSWTQQLRSRDHNKNHDMVWSISR